MTRFARVLTALACVGLTVLWAPIGIDLEAGSRAGHFATAAILNAAVLIVPVLAVRVSRA
jgi:hypothetical protein